jgi:hypothetical protein
MRYARTVAVSSGLRWYVWTQEKTPACRSGRRALNATKRRMEENAGVPIA